MSLWDRHSPRIAYQVPIGVLDLEPQRLMNVTSMNVSRGGMFVGASDLLDVGSEIMCNLPMHRDREAMQLRARVAWQRPACLADDLHPQGMGIEFLDLSDTECDELIDIVGDLEEESHPVRMSLAGLGTDIPAHAKISGDTAHLRVPLNSLRLGAELSFALVDDSTGNQCHGQIESVGIHNDPGSAIPRLQLDLKLKSLGGTKLPPPESKPHYSVDAAVLSQKAAIESGTIEISMAEDDSVPWRGSPIVDDELEEAAVVGSVLSNDTERMFVPLNTDRRLWAGGAVVVLAVIIALAFSLSNTDSSAPFIPVFDRGQGSLLAVPVPEPALTTDDSAKVAAAVEVPTETAAAMIPTAVIPEPAPKQSKAVLAKPVKPIATPRKEVAKTVKAKPKKTKSAKKMSRQNLGGVQLTRRAPEELVIRIPIKGSTEQASNYILASPPAIAVNLPYAKPALGYQRSLYPEDAKVRVVWVRERLGGLHFRVFFDKDVPACKVEIQNKSLELRCKG